jgi:uncharacterized protein (TIGR00369 family)
MISLDPQMERRCRDSFGRQQAMATIGASVHAMRAGEVELIMPFCARLTQQHGFVHAGIITMLCDTACGFAALSLMPADAAVLTTEFKVNLLSPAKGERFIAIGRVVRPGKKLTVCLGEAFAEEGGSRKQIALMTASMMVVDISTGLRD